MFQKTFSFWRHLVGKTPPVQSNTATATATAEEDRRLWTRYETDLSGTVHLAEDPESGKFPATIRDLSLGGANLLLEHAFQPGQILSIELPATPGEIRTVLGCVVRLVAEAENLWSLGCVFSRELSTEDLAQFGAKKLPASDPDQRKWIRFTADMKATYRKVGDPSDQSHSAEVLNVSASGIGLSVTPPLETGTLLNVDLSDKLGITSHTILACAVHTTQRATGELAVGCNFIRELNEEELRSLL